MNRVSGLIESSHSSELNDMFSARNCSKNYIFAFQYDLLGKILNTKRATHL